MEERQEMPNEDPLVSETLDQLLEAAWTYVGEVRHLVDPADTDLLLRLAEECERRLETATTRRQRLEQVRDKLRTAAVLNEHLPITPIGKLGRQTTRTPERRTRVKRNSTGVALPGFEAYHDRLTRWIEQQGISQSAMAQKLEVDPSYLSRAIRGERRNRELFLKIEELTGIAAPIVTEGGTAGKASLNPPGLRFGGDTDFDKVH